MLEGGRVAESLMAAHPPMEAQDRGTTQEFHTEAGLLHVSLRSGRSTRSLAANPMSGAGLYLGTLLENKLPWARSMSLQRMPHDLAPPNGSRLADKHVLRRAPWLTGRCLPRKRMWTRKECP